MKWNTGLIAALAATVALALALAPTGAAMRTADDGAVQQTGIVLPISGTFTDAVGGTGAFAGQFEVERFVARGDQLFAVGTLTGTLTDSLGTVLGTVDQTVRLPVTQAAGTCEILDLTLGPLHLDLLGLVVDLDQVHLVITAEQGPGNLLGNLLCAIAGLLDGQGSTNAIAQLLNRILAILG